MSDSCRTLVPCPTTAGERPMLLCCRRGAPRCGHGCQLRSHVCHLFSEGLLAPSQCSCAHLRTDLGPTEPVHLGAYLPGGQSKLFGAFLGRLTLFQVEPAQFVNLVIVKESTREDFQWLVHSNSIPSKAVGYQGLLGISKCVFAVFGVFF